MSGGGRPTTALLLFGLLVGAAGARQADAPLFPRPLLVEHAIAYVDAAGVEVRGEPVTDVYTGSFLVSLRPGGSKLIVDLAGRQVTGVDPTAGTWWAVSFDGLRRLRERAVELERLGDDREVRARAAVEEAPELVVEELPVRVGSASGAAVPAPTTPGVRRLRVSGRSSDPERPGLEAWVDPGVTLGPRALAALYAFELDVLGGAPGGAAARLDAARRFAGGALPVRTRRPVDLDGAASGPFLEDVAQRVEWLDAPPEGLLEVPAGLTRVPHPLELVVAAGERERALLRGPQR